MLPRDLRSSPEKIGRLPIALGYINPEVRYCSDGSITADPFFDPKRPSEPTRQIDLRQMLEGGIRLAVLSHGNPDPTLFVGAAEIEHVARWLLAVRSAIERRPQFAQLVLNRDDPPEEPDDRVAIILHLTGAPLNGSIHNLDLFHFLGVRSIHPFLDNPVVGGFSDCGNDRLGLRPFGRDLIRRAQELKMVVDLAHANDRSFRETLRICSGPVIDSHTNARKLRSIERNSSNDQIRAIAATGGVVGLHFSSSFIEAPPPQAIRQRAKALGKMHVDIQRLRRRHSDPYEFLSRRLDPARYPEVIGGSIVREPVFRAGMDRLIDHLLHMLDVAGEDHVALGSDYSLGDLCEGVVQARTLPGFVEAVNRRGIGLPILEKILWKNWIRVFRTVLPEDNSYPAPSSSMKPYRRIISN